MPDQFSETLPVSVENEINYNSLFDIWADFNDEESPKEVMRLCDNLGYMDAISFMAFCYGYSKAIQKISN